MTTIVRMIQRKLAIALLLSSVLVLAVQNPPGKPQKKTLTERLAKLVAPWPEPDVIRQRHADADGRELFRTVDPLTFTLESDFGSVNKDRDPNSTKHFPAVLKIAGTDGQQKSVPITISGRGHLRRMAVTCNFIPLRLELPKDQVKGTAFEGPASALKLVTHCQGSQSHEQYILREYLAYKLADILMPHHFRARLAKVTYIDSKAGKPLTTRYGIVLEDDDDVARRMDGRTVSIERTQFKDLEPSTLANMMVFEYLLGNTDFSIFALHNVVIVQLQSKVLYPVPYDFDLSGLVNAPYALPAPRLGIKTVLERAYRGPCLTPEQLESTLAGFKAKKTEVLAAAEGIADLNSDSKREVKQFLNDFYSTIERPSGVKSAFVTGCNNRSTM